VIIPPLFMGISKTFLAPFGKKLKVRLKNNIGFRDALI
jgi:hypothetical protein